MPASRAPSAQSANASTQPAFEVPRCAPDDASAPSASAAGAARTRQWRLWVQLLLTVGLALALVWAAVIGWQSHVNRNNAIAQARDFSLSMHEATMAGLTGMMVTGTIAQRAVFLDQIKQLNAIREVQVVRGDAVAKVFGPGEASAPRPDAVEQQVLASGKAYIAVEHDAQGEYLRAVRPTVALKNYLGKDCTTCHQVAEHTVLGVVSMKMSLDQVNAALAEQLATSILAALITCIPVLLVIYPFIRKVVTRPLEQGIAVARHIATGDLTRSVDARSSNEIGSLLQSLQHMGGNLSQLLAQVRGGTRTITGAARQLADGNRDLSARTDAQAQSLQAATASMATLTDAVRRNAERAAQADQQASVASNVAERGGQMVAQVVERMDAIQTSSARIADITSVIDSIAFQTNILALNAAVEAARAGEQGRGFAVVASEVRMLAKRSADAAGEIKRLIDTSVSEVDSGTRLVRETGTTMAEVVHNVRQVNAIIGGISSASSEQIGDIERVGHEITQLDDVTRRNAALVDEATRSTTALHEQAQTLQRLVSTFRLKDDSDHPACAEAAAPGDAAP